METRSTQDDQRAEKIVVTVGMLLTYGITGFTSFILTVLSVGAEKRFTYGLAAVFAVVLFACFAFSIRLAQQRKPIRAILLGLVPVPVVMTVAYMTFEIVAAFN